VSQEAIPVAMGSTSPSAPAISATPMKRMRAGGTSVAQGALVASSANGSVAWP
jgi:hypothetical protein